jgi:hypothetical protein
VTMQREREENDRDLANRLAAAEARAAAAQRRLEDAETQNKVISMRAVRVYVCV